ncbi:MAG: dTMP kinase [Patescibacteria group bacterium]
MKRKGKLIVIDGIDGSGKATQADLLKKRLTKEGFKVKSIDFPRYYDNFFGAFIGECLSGEHGDFIKTNPRVVSVLYAADRFESLKDINKWLHEGFWVIADRYVSANQIHQGGKIKDPRKRKEFLDWLEKMEHQVFGLPYPDIVFYLDVPLEVSRSWLKNKEAQKNKRYLKGKKDVAETDIDYLKNSRNTALSLERRNDNWIKILCCPKGVVLSPEEVHRKVFEIIENRSWK